MERSDNNSVPTKEEIMETLTGGRKTRSYKKIMVFLSVFLLIIASTGFGAQQYMKNSPESPFTGMVTAAPGMATGWVSKMTDVLIGTGSVDALLNDSSKFGIKLTRKTINLKGEDEALTSELTKTCSSQKDKMKTDLEAKHQKEIDALEVKIEDLETDLSKCEDDLGDCEDDLDDCEDSE